jgi:DNA-directed RNA polymerase subunit RPC12/RpoP
MNGVRPVRKLPCAHVSNTPQSNDGAVLSITCPRCGHTFETAARTNTRCRRCRHVVNVGRSSTVSPSYPETDSTEAYMVGVSLPVLGLAIAGVGAFALWHGVTLQAPPDADPAAVRRARVLWCAGGGAAVVLGLLLVVRSVRPAS